MKPTLKHQSIRRLRTDRIIQKYGNSIIVSTKLCKSRFVIGPHWPGIVITYALIIGGTYINLRMLQKNKFYSETTHEYTEKSIYLFFPLTMLTLFLAACSDPGIMFSSSSDYIDEEVETGLVNTREIAYCDVCNVYQHPKRNIEHCYDCNYCIEGLDHHCPWMGQCVGKKNMKSV